MEMMKRFQLKNRLSIVSFISILPFILILQVVVHNLGLHWVNDLQVSDFSLFCNVTLSGRIPTGVDSATLELVLDLN